MSVKCLHNNSVNIKHTNYRLKFASRSFFFVAVSIRSTSSMMLLQRRISTAVAHRKELVCHSRVVSAPRRTFWAGKPERAKSVPTCSVLSACRMFFRYLCSVSGELYLSFAGDDSWCAVDQPYCCSTCRAEQRACACCGSSRAMRVQTSDPRSKQPALAAGVAAAG